MTNSKPTRNLSTFPKLGVLILFGFLCAICNMVVFALAVGGFLFNFRTGPETFLPYEQPHILDHSETGGFRQYIEPTDSIENETLAESAAINFYIDFHEDTDRNMYEYETEFIRLNLEYEYQQLRARLGQELLIQTEILITDQQEVYEDVYGFDYTEKLPYAGLSTQDRMVILIAPDKSYDKEGLNSLLAHELVHLFQFQANNQISKYPLWFVEGGAEYFSSSQHYPIYTSKQIEKFNTLTALEEKMADQEVEVVMDAYNTSHLFLRYLVDQYGEDTLSSVMFPTDGAIAFEDSFANSFGSTPDTLYRSWVNSLPE